MVSDLVLVFHQPYVENFHLNMARQQKRRRTYNDSEHASSESDPKRTRQKHGRSQMRTVTRTARRGQRPDEVEDINPTSLDTERENEENSEPEEAAEADDGKAYNALLTLLKSDIKAKPRTPSLKKIDVDDEEDEEGSEEEVEDDQTEEIAGANIEEDEEEEEEDAKLVADDGSDLEEDDDSKNVSALQNNPFEVHFNLINGTYVDEQEKLVVKEKQRWLVGSKSKIPDSNYVILSTLPPGKSIQIPNQGVVRNSLKDFSLKNRILEAHDKHYPGSVLSPIDLKLSDPIFNYQDVSYAYQSFKNTAYRKLYSLHALNHIFTTRDRIIKNTSKLHAFRESNKGTTGEEEPEFRDQGFTRPKVLILLPTRNACHEVVEQMIQLSGSEQVENKKKFSQQFYSKEFPPDSKPEDFRDHFRGNSNDFFCMGIKFTRKALKLYSSFYSSDIILASPIGLSMILENPDKKKRQYDFLSSIEILVVDKANQIEMQNWDHVSTVLKYLNKIPKEFHNADFSRIRMWCINDQSRLLRQTLIFSEYLTPNINNLLSSKSTNLAGKIKFKPLVDSSTCIMNSIGIKIKQMFQRFDTESPLEDPEFRFKFFINSVLPSLMKSTSYNDGIMIFIPSYYDYLRIKSYMKSSTKFSFGSLDEYSSQSKLDRVRRSFIEGKTKIILYTERLHYFRRYEIAGVKTLLMYGIPSNPLFYKELVRFIGRSVYKGEADLDLAFVKVLYSKLDAVTLERVVGGERCGVLCNSVNEVYEFR